MSDLVAILGIASARIYAAFDSKEALFREAIALYEANEGSFAARALEEESTARQAMERMLREAAQLYTRSGRPRGCMVVTSAVNCAHGNDAVLEWLAGHRRERTAAIVARIKRAAREGELKPETNAEALGDCLAVTLHGLSVQARDGVSRARLLALIPSALRGLEGAAV